MRLQPQAASYGVWIDTSLVPLRRFIATAMNLTMVSATERDRELVADLAAQRVLGQSANVGHRRGGGHRRGTAALQRI